MLELLGITLFAVLLDVVVGEPKRFHPLVGLGKWIANIERYLNAKGKKQGNLQLNGVVGVLLALLPALFLIVIFYLVVPYSPLMTFFLSGFLLYLCIGLRSLGQHALAVANPLHQGNIAAAREAVGMIVSRESAELDEEGIAKATIESVLENGADAVFSAIFWFWVAGVPGVVIYRVVNTLDAMWGYKNDRFLHFGRFAAKLDDVMNWVPARLTALSYAICGHFKDALYCWREQAKTCQSPNGGAVMTSGAGALGVRLGGDAIYHGRKVVKPAFGLGARANAAYILRANRLLLRSLYLWLAVFGLITGVTLYVS